MLKAFKEKVEELIRLKFNLIIYGENGCGKTTLVNEVIKKLEDTYCLKINVAHFVNIKDFLELIEDDLKDFLTNRKDLNMPGIEDLIKIKKFNDLFQVLDEFSTQYEIYIVIDGLDDLNIVMTFKKYLQKIFVLNSNFPRVKIILISNFDISKSEVCNLFDLSAFISLNFPAIKNESEMELKEILFANLNLGDYKSLNKDQAEVVNRILLNYQSNISNLNEYIYCLKDIDLASLIKPKEYNINELTNELNNISLSNEIQEFKFNQKFQEDEFITVNRTDRETNEFIDRMISEKESKISKIKKGNLHEKVQSQLIMTPIHIKNINDSESKFADNLYSTKNLTESLSRSQKLIILAAFFATESSPKLDSVIFKTVKRSKGRIFKNPHHNVKSLRSKINHSFTLQRLIAIYCSLQTLQRDEENDDLIMETNIELLSDINTLINLNLIRYVKINEMNYHSRKMMGNVGIDFATKIANDFGLKLDNFVSLEKF